MLHSLSKDTVFTGERAPRHTFVCGDSQCLPPGDPRILCAKQGYPITGKSFITLSVIGNRFAVVAVEIRPPPARTKIGPLACYRFTICVPYMK